VETGKETSGYICQTASCQKTFANPLKTVNVGISAEPYDACPFCLAEITSEARVDLQDLPKKQKPCLDEKTQVSVQAVVAEPGCKNHFGFLSERSSKGQIPDECMTCRRTIECMLKKPQE